ncbi:MAG: hypothetical protein LBR71_07240 [Synergistaceae bacterium]|jgi:hypothetical protein|nr:hypothetical protein [Synergistaceae bacterium]
MELITRKKKPCSFTVDKKIFTARARLPRAKSGLIILSSGQELSGKNLRPIEDPMRDHKALEANLNTFYIALALDEIKHNLGIHENIEFSFNGHYSYESASIEDLGAFFAMTFRLAENKPEQREANNAYVKFHLERDLGGILRFDPGQTALYRMFVERCNDDLWMIDHHGVWRMFIVSSNAPTISERKRNLTNYLLNLTGLDPNKLENYEALLRANCYRLWT